MLDQEQHAATPPPVAHEQTRKARLQIGRRVAPLILIAVALCAVVVWQRDARHIQVARQRIRAHAEPLKRYLGENATLPLVYPRYSDQNILAGSSDFRYVGEEVIRWARSADRPAVIGYGPNNGLIVRPNGHAVLYHEGGELRDGWLSGRELGSILAEQESLARTADPGDG